MTDDLLERLQCPLCGGSFRVLHARTAPGGEIEYGILACACHEFPVLAGIPILKGEGRVDVMRQTADSTLVPGPEVSRLIDLLRHGRGEEALLMLLVMPDPWTRRLQAIAELLPEKVRRVPRGLARRSWARLCAARREFLLGDPGKRSAMEMIRFFYQDSVRAEVFHYFACRFGQPRHLAALSLGRLLPASDRPILDLACGFGHFTHYWRAGHPAHPVVGVDRNFFQLFVAKRWVAPGGEFVCSDADVRLPFRSGSFCGSFCSDAFHCFLRRLQSGEEMKRVVERGGPILLARVGNRQLEPREGYELAADEYASLFQGFHTRMRSEEELLDDYLAGRGPRLAEDADPARLAGQKWLSLAASEDPATLRDHDGFREWPHGVGTLKVNPLYRPTDGEHLTFQFPSRWYEFENRDCLRYMPREAAIGPSTRDLIEHGVRTPEVLELIRQCVVVGMPERYL